MFEGTTRSHTRIPVGEGLIGVVALERRPLTTADAARDARVKNRATFEALGLRAFLAVPLLHDGRLLGVLSGARTSARPFEAEDLQMLEALADHAAAVLEQVRLLQESERRRRTAEALAALAAETSAAQSPESILDRVLGYVQELVAADVTYLAVHEPQVEATSLLVVRGARGPSFARLTFRPGQGAIGRVMADGQPFRTADYLSEPRISHEFDHAVREEGVTAVLVVPVRLKGTVVGVLGGSRRESRPFTDDDERVLVQLAAQAAVALGNVWLYHEVARGKQQWETTVNHLHDGLALLDSDLRILQINRALAGWIGQGPEGLVGRAVGEVLPVYATAGAQARLAAARAGSGSNTVTIEDDRGRVLEETLAPVTQAAGTPAGLVVTLRDVTDARRLQSQLLTTEKLASLGEMLAGIAHELNNPLTGVLGFAQLLEAQVTEPAQREDLRKLAHEAQRAARLVQRLLRFARQHPPERRSTDLNALVQAAVELLEGTCRREGIALEAELAGDLPVTFADPHQLQQLVVNLATNARQAMASAGRRGRVRLSTRRDGGWLELRVSDEGPGIRPEVLPRIFDPFFTTKAPGEGTGLGLSLCHSVVMAHGGDIWAESVPDRGATLHVRLPVVLPLAPEPEAAPAPATEGHAARPRRVLVADDEPSLRDLMLKALTPRGHVVETVADGAAALERLQAAPYDVLLLDLRMPGLDGRETLERLRADPPAAPPRVVIMTGDSVRPETRSWLEGTGLPVLGKPFTLEALVAAVEESA
jgi:two-component system NtrC family sensor kinase